MIVANEETNGVFLGNGVQDTLLVEAVGERPEGRLVRNRQEDAAIGGRSIDAGRFDSARRNFDCGTFEHGG